MVLKHLAYPCRFNDMIHRFGRAEPELSMITNTVEEFIYQNHHHWVTRWNENLLSPVKLQEYADAVTEKGSPLRNCFGFIDGTFLKITITAIIHPFSGIVYTLFSFNMYARNIFYNVQCTYMHILKIKLINRLLIKTVIYRGKEA